MKREAGVLLPVTALMSGYGIGDLGRGADAFIDFIARMGFSVWQVLPVTRIGEGNSPYSGESAFAGNYLLIDIEQLPERLLTEEEKAAARYQGSVYKADYDYAKETKTRLLRLAYQRLNAEDRAEIERFLESEKDWLPDYATYMAQKKESGREFSDWEPGIRRRDPAALSEARERLKAEIFFYCFEQYLFFSQWRALKERANMAGVRIMGDIPIYISYNSCDVWANPGLFELDKDLRQKRVAGVPPDYFAEEGQLWGNPLYDYKKMKKDGFTWWIKRLKHNLKLYDILKIDHFRGLCEYWAVPCGAKDARCGKWEKGPGLSIWRELKKTVKDPPIVAEDLGLIDEKVVKYLKQTGFPGMRVLQFAFDGKPGNPHLPYNYEYNTVAYTATHDNNTTLGWLYELDGDTREKVLSYLSVDGAWGMGGGGAPAVRAAIKEVIASVSKLAVIPMQDLCGYGSDTRINIPGKPDGNWEYRITASAMEEVDQNYILYLNRKYGRTGS